MALEKKTVQFWEHLTADILPTVGVTVDTVAYDTQLLTSQIWNGTAWVDEVNILSELVPYAGAISDVDLNTKKVTQGQAQFNTVTANPTHSEGLVFYDQDRKAVSYYNEDPDVTVNIGQEILIRVYNASGAAIINGQVVRANGSFGGLPTVVLSQADTTANAKIAGLATATIENNSIGYIAAFGALGGIDTSTYTVGDTLYLSATVAGAITNVEQPILAPLGLVLIADASGDMFVRLGGILNLTAIGQSIGGARVQVLTATPQPITAYEESGDFALNTVVTHTGATDVTANISPLSVGVSGHYRVAFNVSITSIDNELLTFEAYLNGLPSGVLCVVDMRNNNIDAGNGSINAVSKTVLTAGDVIEIYGYTDGAAANLIYTSTTFNIERIGNF